MRRYVVAIRLCISIKGNTDIRSNREKFLFEDSFIGKVHFEYLFTQLVMCSEAPSTKPVLSNDDLKCLGEINIRL